MASSGTASISNSEHSPEMEPPIQNGARYGSNQGF